MASAVKFEYERAANEAMLKLTGAELAAAAAAGDQQAAEEIGRRARNKQRRVEARRASAEA